MSTHSVIVSGTEYILDGSLGITVMEQDGFGMSPSHRMTQRGVQQHGITDRGFLLDPRVMHVKLGIEADTVSEWDVMRYLALGIFKAADAQFTYRYVRDGKTRDIQVVCTGGLTLDTLNKKGFTQIEVAELQASDPAWYNPETQTLICNVASAVGGELTIPLYIPMYVGSSTIDSTFSMVYGGTWIEYPRILVHGPITDLVISNVETGEKLDFTGYSLADGSYIWIDCRYGYKLVLLNSLTYTSAANLIDKLTNDSDLSTFHIERSPVVAGGINTIHITGNTANQNTIVSFQYNERFIGV